MSIFQILETLLIGPLKLLFEFIFELSGRFVSHPGIMIVFLSLIMNILVLPLYRRADAMQEEARDTESRLHKGVAHIKKVFSGDEKMMILQTYYRQNHYKPTDALRGSTSLLLEIPFFMAAYQYLSHVKILQGVSFGPIADLSKPDGLLVIGGFAINLLPFLMTFVNIVSSALYLKGFPLKTKIQLYGMAAFFLVFLYASPSGLVFYWTLNNVFSLVKTIFYKIKNPGKVLRYMTAVAGIAFILLGAVFYPSPTIKKRLFLIGVGIALLLPLILHTVKPLIHFKRKETSAEPKKSVFVCAAVFLTILVGIVIPSTVIASSPQEFVELMHYYNPIWYIVSSFLMAAGTFLVWMRVFYWLANPTYKVLFEKVICALCGVAVVNYMFFGTNLGVLSSSFQFENGLNFSFTEQLINLAVSAVIALVIYLLSIKWRKIAVPAILTVSIALGAMSIINITKINTSLGKIVAEGAEETPNFRLSKKGKNVVVIMLDRGMGEFIPYIFEEKPELKETYAGFTFYENTVSFGGFTNFGVPSLVGGYEYTPVEMNKRKNETLVSKHNEALKVLPVLFNNNGYEVTICDPPYANYQWIPDLSVFDEYPEIKTYITEGRYSEPEVYQQGIDNKLRNTFVYGLMKTLPLCFQTTVYADGTYNQSQTLGVPNYITQTVTGTSKATGLSKTFMSSYNVITNLSSITNVTNDKKNTFMFLSNSMTHEPALLSEPDYIPAEHIDNTAYDAKHTDRFVLDGKTLDVSNNLQMSHYHTNMSAILRLGEWLDYLRANDVYDNTRIIIVSDHGRGLSVNKELILDSGSDNPFDIGFYYPFLLVKDFDSTEFTISDEFMTNADVPTLATKGIIDRPINPFTGKEINNREKTAHDQFITRSNSWNTSTNNENTFSASSWASVKGDLRDKHNWTFYNKDIVLSEHAFPEE
ncbi:MAG: YidC/Oxa1 family membrane protein insertase [Acutalibacteraceae bacterium]